MLHHPSAKHFSTKIIFPNFLDCEKWQQTICIAYCDQGWVATFMRGKPPRVAAPHSAWPAFPQLQRCVKNPLVQSSSRNEEEASPHWGRHKAPWLKDWCSHHGKWGKMSMSSLSLNDTMFTSAVLKAVMKTPAFCMNSQVQMEFIESTST